ncbi:MAG: methyltransferase domain-containing protein [Desulfatirhabdiaceae bacterium]
MTSDFVYYIDEFTYFENQVFIRGWAFYRGLYIVEQGYNLPGGVPTMSSWQGNRSEDVESVYGKIGSNARFQFLFHADTSVPENILSIQLIFNMSDGSEIRLSDLWMEGIKRGPYGEDQLIDVFRNEMQRAPEGARVLEIGSRARSGISNRESVVPKHLRFTGLDIISGECVDVVGDAHDLTRYFSRNTFDFVYSLNVFEHLLMPWKVVIEMNRVMKKGGLAMILTHHAFPLHDIPCDFWRFSDKAWHGLFNAFSGFEVVRTALYDRVRVLPYVVYQGTYGTQHASAFVHSMVIARKIQNTRLKWKVNVDQILESLYPE